MAAQWTLQIVGASTYTFDGVNHIQPTVNITWDKEYNYNQVPAVIAADLELWDLRGFVFRDSTPSNIASDVETLAAILRGKSTQVASAVLLYNGTPYRTLAGTSLVVKGMRLVGGPGSLVNHWEGDLSIVARTLLPDNSDIVFLDKELFDSYDEVGLHTQTMSGKIEVMPGTDLTTTIQAFSFPSLGSNYVMKSDGPDGPFDIRITNSPSDTKATFIAQQKELGENMPSGALNWARNVSTSDASDGRTASTSTVARAAVLATALSAARSAKPTTGVRITQERQDATSLTVSATYSTLAPRPAQAGFYIATGKINFIERTVTIEGGGNATNFTRINGYVPFETIAAQGEILVREHVRVHAIGVQSIADIPLPERLFPASYLQPSSVDGPPYRTDKAEQDGADSWSRDSFRLYAIGDAKLVDFNALFAKIKDQPTYADKSDFEARAAVVLNA